MPGEANELDNVQDFDIVMPGDKKSDDPAGDKDKKDDPAADKDKKDDPTADKDKKDDPTADKDKKDDPAADKDKKDDPTADKDKKDDPAADKDKKDDPAADKDKKDDPAEGLIKIVKKDDADKDKGGDKDAVAEEVDWDELSKDVGVEVKSQEDIIESLKELASLKKLSPALQQAIEIERNKGDVAAYFRSLANDPDKISERDALWLDYAQQNPKKISQQGEKFSRKEFERNLQSDYKILMEYNSKTGDEKEEFLKEHKDDIEFQQEKFNASIQSARANLKETNSKIKFYEPTTEMTEEEETKILEKHQKDSKAALSSFKSVAIPVGDEFVFKIGINDVNRKTVTDWVTNPKKLLEEIGFMDQTIDYGKLVEFATLLADIRFGKFGEKFRTSVLANKDITTLDRELETPGKVRRQDTSTSGPVDDWEAVAQGFENKRSEKK